MTLFLMHFINIPHHLPSPRSFAQVTAAQALWLPALSANSPAEQKALMDNAVPDFWGYQTCTEFAFYQTWCATLLFIIIFFGGRRQERAGKTQEEKTAGL